MAASVVGVARAASVSMPPALATVLSAAALAASMAGVARAALMCCILATSASVLSAAALGTPASSVTAGEAPASSCVVSGLNRHCRNARGTASSTPPGKQTVKVMRGSVALMSATMPLKLRSSQRPLLPVVVLYHCSDAAGPTLAAFCTTLAFLCSETAIVPALSKLCGCAWRQTVYSSKQWREKQTKHTKSRHLEL